jgi:hypothetical protein
MTTICARCNGPIGHNNECRNPLCKTITAYDFYLSKMYLLKFAPYGHELKEKIDLIKEAIKIFGKYEAYKGLKKICARKRFISKILSKSF